jgi:hypothetical protein
MYYKASFTHGQGQLKKMKGRGQQLMISGAASIPGEWVCQ